MTSHFRTSFYFCLFLFILVVEVLYNYNEHVNYIINIIIFCLYIFVNYRTVDIYGQIILKEFMFYLCFIQFYCLYNFRFSTLIKYVFVYNMKYLLF